MNNEAELITRTAKKIGTYEMVLSSTVMPTSLSKDFLHRTIHDAGHDLKSPLFVIRGYSQLLQRTEDKDCMRRGIKLIEEASYKLENIVNGFVELMDIYTRPNIEKEPILLDSIIDNIALSLSSLKENIGMVINKNFKSNEELFFNEAYLTTILTSLIDNAIRHNLNQEDLTVDIIFEQMADGSILLGVEDNGIGIDLLVDEKTLKKPFYKSGENIESIGIGLAKIEAIAKVTNNIFTIESAQGEGTVCKFIFQI